MVMESVRDDLEKGARDSNVLTLISRWVRLRDSQYCFITNKPPKTKNTPKPISIFDNNWIDHISNIFIIEISQ